VRLASSLGPAFLGGSAEAEAVGAGFDGVRPIGDAIQQRLTQASVGNRLSPLEKGQCRGQDDGCLFGTLGDDLEEELRSEVGHRHLAHSVDGYQVMAFPSSQHAAQLQLLLGLDQFVEQRGSSGEMHLFLLLAGGYA
jgi:hypothetical protein